ncbi:hypothetical protein [Fictibacillus barbaricus]|uniref:Uncharacterized protein n=1 Tax=Fictibacillus barbaricus TaxID=182136 RepID=A0ABS2ZGZ3_9BACL|nr:hypothetical protein [Fictibacillus barbaricus]MBN3546696.1 hypothetical protein [Fictibacillus barbaricus]GGB43092.1 hypothetical protein GCM10007199_05500 [Fictibacillus barbaricus]
MLKQKKNLKNFWLTVGAVLIAPVVLNMTIFQFGTPFTYGDGDEWLSFWGNYTGGLVSAYVAYFIANSQIKKQLEIDMLKQRQTNLLNQLPALIRLKNELGRKRGQLFRANGEMQQYISENGRLRSERNPQGIPSGAAYQKTIQVEPMREDIWIYIEKIDDVDLQVELMNALQFYKDFSEAVSKEFKNFPAQGPTQRDREEWEKLYNKKNSVWYQFYHENVPNKFGILYKRIDDELEKVKALKEKGN